MTITRRTALAGMAAFGFMPQMAAANGAYPHNRLTLIAPFDAGGSADRLARAIAMFLGKELGDIPVNVVNRSGGSGALGHSWFIRQPADGATVLISPINPYLISHTLRGQAGLKWEDFHFVNGQWQDYYVVLTHKNQPYQSMAEVLLDAKENPGKVSCGIIPGDGGHLSALILLEKLGIPADNINWVTYDGGGPMRTAIAGDQVTLTFVSALGSDVIMDQVRPLAVYRESNDDERLWDCPPINEAIAELDVEVPVLAADLRCFTVHQAFKDEHPETYEMLVSAYQRMLEREDFKAYIAEAKIGGMWMGPDATKESLEASYAIFEEYLDKL